MGLIRHIVVLLAAVLMVTALPARGRAAHERHRVGARVAQRLREVLPGARHWATALALYRQRFVPLRRAVCDAWTFRALESHGALSKAQLRQLSVIEKTTRRENEGRLPPGLSPDVTARDPHSGATLFTQQAADRVLSAFRLVARGQKRSARVFRTQPQEKGTARRIAGSDEAFLLTAARSLQKVLRDVPWVDPGGASQLEPEEAKEYVENVAYPIPSELKSMMGAASLHVFFAGVARDLYGELVHPGRTVPQL